MVPTIFLALGFSDGVALEAIDFSPKAIRLRVCACPHPTFHPLPPPLRFRAAHAAIFRLRKFPELTKNKMKSRPLWPIKTIVQPQDISQRAKRPGQIGVEATVFVALPIAPLMTRDRPRARTAEEKLLNRKQH